MNPKGKCVLNIRSSINNSTADVLSEDGNLISRYIKTEDSSSSLSLSSSSRRNENNSTENIEWNFQGLLISFDPKMWCIYVTFQQSKVYCRFSSISGGEILSNDLLSLNENTDANDTNNTNVNDGMTTIDKSFSHKKEKKNIKESKGQLISTESHEDIRCGLQSIVSNLDDMLAQMRNK